MGEYIICQFSENVHDSKGQVLNDQSGQMKSRLGALLLAFRQYLASISEEGWHSLLQHLEVKGIETYLMEQRQKVKDQLNPEIERG